jgi:hypothetical protein
MVPVAELSAARERASRADRDRAVQVMRPRRRVAPGGAAAREIRSLRLRALLAEASGDDIANRDLVTRYRTTAESFGFEENLAWAEAMAEVADP